MVNRYFLTQRPPMPGGIPMPVGNRPTRVVGFDSKRFCAEIGRDAYGYVEYAEQLTPHDMEAYELTEQEQK